MTSIYDAAELTEGEGDAKTTDMEMQTPRTPLVLRANRVVAAKLGSRLVAASLLVGAVLGIILWVHPGTTPNQGALQLASAKSEKKQPSGSSKPKTKVRLISEGVINGAAAASTSVTPMVELGPDEMEIGLPREKCSRIGESCLATKCCSFSGYLCFEKNKTWASCLKKCKPGQSNGQLSKDDTETNKPHVQPITRPSDKKVVKSNDPFFRPIEPGPWTCNRPRSLIHIVKAKPSPGTKLYCFQLMLTDGGGSKRPQTDFSLVRTQLHTRTSIFGCESWTVFSDVKTWLSPEVDGEREYTVPVEFPKQAKRPNSRAWVNTPLYVNVWTALKAQPNFMLKDWDWIVKVDPGTVFFPIRLREILKQQKVTENGVFLENCKYVRYGFFGSLEVMDKKAATVLADKTDQCLEELPWEHAQHAHGRYYGEDKFLQKCMELHGIDKVPSEYEAGVVPSDGPSGLLTTLACPAHKTKADVMKEKALTKSGDKATFFPNCATTKTAAMHIFTKPEDYFECLRKSPLNVNYTRDDHTKATV